jgi:hypothetical protein
MLSAGSPVFVLSRSAGAAPMANWPANAIEETSRNQFISRLGNSDEFSIEFTAEPVPLRP